MTSDQDNSARIANLARQIASCPSVETAYSGQHQCSDIVGWQRIELRKLGVPESQIRNRLHRPEPWAGNLSSAKIVYLSSNPSFNDDENFPGNGMHDRKSFCKRRLKNECVCRHCMICIRAMSSAVGV